MTINTIVNTAKKIETLKKQAKECLRDNCLEEAVIRINEAIAMKKYLEETKKIATGKTYEVLRDVLATI